MLRLPVIALALSLIGSSCFASPSKSQSLPPTVVEIKVEAIKSADYQVQKVLFTDLIQGKDAVKFISLWNSLKLTPGSVKYLPNPKYRLTFYEAKSKLHGYAAICFDPGTLLPLKIDYPNQLGSPIVFENDDTALQIHKMLSRLFDDFDPIH